MRAKKLKNNLITYGIVIAAYILFQALLSAGALSSLLKGLLVPICVYIVLAVSLNLVVGISGELSLGHAGFMCVGAFGGAFFSKCVQETITNQPAAAFLLAMLIGGSGRRRVRTPDRHPGSETEGRLPGHRDPGLR